ncbi:hypothetical protein N9966_00605 [bacterium]|jgi:hypothetical protein|nr:hypothetical protein [bacterium]
MNKTINFIYGIIDKTGDCPFCIAFYKEKKDALKELNRQVNSTMMEFGWEPYIDGDKVCMDDKELFTIQKFRLN